MPMAEPMPHPEAIFLYALRLLHINTWCWIIQSTQIQCQPKIMHEINPLKAQRPLAGKNCKLSDNCKALALSARPVLSADLAAIG
jgi:hypothetical protein